jgi:hypothetical protein
MCLSFLSLKLMVLLLLRHILSMVSGSVGAVGMEEEEAPTFFMV